MTDYVLLPKIPIELPDIHLMTLEEFRANRDMVESFTNSPFGLDYESNTWDYVQKDFSIRTVGLSNDQYTLSIDLLGASEGDTKAFTEWLSDRQYVAHNVGFEAGASYRWFGSYGKPIADTYVLFADLATEYKRPWNLETAMDDLLGLKKEGDKVKDHMKANKWDWSDVDKFDFEVLGRYNAIDAYGHWQLYKYFQKIVASYESTWGAYYWDYHQQDCLNQVLLGVEARWHGIHVDTIELEKSYTELVDSKEEAIVGFFGNDEIKPHVDKFNEVAISDVVDNPPPKMTTTKPIRMTKRYEKWLEKVEVAKKEQHFNTNSTAHLRWLFFDMMKLPILEFTPGGDPSTAKDVLAKMGIHGRLLLDYREVVNKLKFVTQLREGLEGETIHPSVKDFGTLTTRCSGGKLE